jgi:5'-nucleotidase
VPLRLLHTNDLHGKLTEERLPALLQARERADLYFDTGDAVAFGNVAIPVGPDPVWPRLVAARCSASVIGNRETHLLEPVFRAKLAGAAHPVLCANLVSRDGAAPLRGSVVLEAAGLRVGVFGVSVPMVTERMAARIASAFLWSDPVEAARAQVAQLRPVVDVLIALTNLGLGRDRSLIEAVPGIDVLLGGHSHDVLSEPILLGRTWIAQGGSHARFFGMYEYEPESRRLTGGLAAWG